MMREILFRGKIANNKGWVYGNYLNYHKTTHCVDFDSKENNVSQIVYETMLDWELPNEIHYIDVIPETVGQYTGVQEFSVSDRTICKRLFEGDIVKVWAQRLPKWDYQPRSQHDGDCEALATIKWKHSGWYLDFDNAHNSRIVERFPGEQTERHINGARELDWYDMPTSRRDEYRQTNPKSKRCNIVKVGNIWDNPELLT